MKKSAPSPAATQSPVEQQALGLSEQQRAQQQGALGQVGQTVATAQQPLNNLTATNATGTTNYREQLGQGLTSSTNQAYNNAASSSRLNALRSGLQNQPLQVGNENALDAQRAKSLAQIPLEVNQQATPLELQASGLQNQLANTQLGVARTYNPEGYFGQAAGMEDQRQNALNQQYQQQKQQSSGLWGGLAKAGLGLIQPFKL